jgi:hypothetical protein
MNAETFMRKRARIASEHPPSTKYYKKALDGLTRDADAALLVIDRKIVGWRLKTGEIVCTKERFRDEADARAALAAIHRSSFEGARVPIRSYYCSRCKGFHLTSQPFHTTRSE